MPVTRVRFPSPAPAFQPLAVHAPLKSRHAVTELTDDFHEAVAEAGASSSPRSQGRGSPPASGPPSKIPMPTTCGRGANCPANLIFPGRTWCWTRPARRRTGRAAAAGSTAPAHGSATTRPAECDRLSEIVAWRGRAHGRPHRRSRSVRRRFSEASTGQSMTVSLSESSAERSAGASSSADPIRQP